MEEYFNFENVPDFFTDEIVEKYSNNELIDSIKSNNELYNSILSNVNKQLSENIVSEIFPKMQYKLPILYENKSINARIQLGTPDSYSLLKDTPFENHVKYYTYLSDSPVEILDKYVEQNIQDNVNYFGHFKYKLIDHTIFSIKIRIYKKEFNYLYKILNDDITNLSYFYYEFLKIKDDIYVNYLRKFFFPRIHLANEKNRKNIVFNNSNFLKRVQDEISKMVSKEIYELFCKFNIYISGSFILKMLSDKDNNIECSDLDCYIKADKYQLILSYLSNEGIYYIVQNPNSYHMKNIKNILEISTRNHETNIYTKIQFIFVEENPYHFIRRNYDFDSCMNTFNLCNHKLNIGHHNPQRIDVMRISELYMAKIFIQKDNYSNYRAAKTIERCAKYIRRGFFIENIDDFLYRLESSM